MDVQVGGGAKALDQRDGAGVRFAAFEPYLFDQKGGHDAVAGAGACCYAAAVAVALARRQQKALESD